MSSKIIRCSFGYQHNNNEQHNWTSTTTKYKFGQQHIYSLIPVFRQILINSYVHVYIYLFKFHVLLLKLLNGFNKQKRWHYWIKTTLLNFVYRQRHHKIIHDWCNVYFPAYNNDFLPAIHITEICRVGGLGDLASDTGTSILIFDCMYMYLYVQ